MVCGVRRRVRGTCDLEKAGVASCRSVEAMVWKPSSLVASYFLQTHEYTDYADACQAHAVCCVLCAVKSGGGPTSKRSRVLAVSGVTRAVMLLCCRMALVQCRTFAFQATPNLRTLGSYVERSGGEERKATERRQERRKTVGKKS